MQNNIIAPVSTAPSVTSSSAFSQSSFSSIQLNTTNSSAHLPTAPNGTLGLTTPTALSSQAISLANPNASPFFPQFLYWYPTPPVSPSSAIYIHPSSMLHAPSIVILRGVPLSANVQDIMNLLNGFPEVNYL